MAWTGCFIKWTKTTQFIRSTCTVCRSGTRLGPFPQQRCAFRREARRPETKKGNVAKETDPLLSDAADGVQHKAGTSPSPSPAPPPPPPPPRRVARPNLFKPMMFTVGFTGCSFGMAAILQYESLRLRVLTAREEAEKNSDINLQGPQDMTYWHDWWKQLSEFQKRLILLMTTADDFWSSLSEGQRTVSGIIAINTVVLCCWRVPRMQRSMVKYFTSNPASKTRCLPMALSTFSHYSIIHMVANMWVLWTFSSSIVSLLGREQFLAVYTSAGVISNMVSYVCKTATGRLHPSLGASGAVMTVLAAVCTKVPEAKLGIILLPVITFSAGNALKALLAIDTAGLLMGWRIFDHAAHLGGALFGVWYVSYGHKLMWRQREPLLKFWHTVRSPGTGGGKPGSGPGVSSGSGPK